MPAPGPLPALVSASAVQARIEAEDGSVIDDLEQESELPTSEWMIQTLKAALAQGLRRQIEALPDEIRQTARTRT